MFFLRARISDSNDYRRRFRLAVGVVLVAAGFFGFIHASLASWGQILYHRTKHGFFLGRPSLEVLSLAHARDEALDRAIAATNPVIRAEALSEALAIAREGARRGQLALSLCPENYFFPAYVARLQLDALLNVHDEAVAADLKRAAFYFAKEGLRLNPYDAEVRSVYVDTLLVRGDVDEALAFWEPIVDREFWQPDNHDVYARILLRRSARKGGGPYLAKAADERFFVTDPALKKRLANLAKLAPKQ